MPFTRMKSAVGTIIPKMTRHHILKINQTYCLNQQIWEFLQKRNNSMFKIHWIWIMKDESEIKIDSTPYDLANTIMIIR